MSKDQGIYTGGDVYPQGLDRLLRILSVSSFMKSKFIPFCLEEELYMIQT